jgi:hypothetical protein
MSTLAAFVLLTFRGGNGEGSSDADKTTPDVEEDAFWTFAAVVAHR